MAVMLVAPGVAHAACANEDAPFTSISALAAAEAVSCLANEQRAAAGKVTLARNGKLTRIAQGHAEYIGSSGNFSHVDDEGESPTDRATAVGYNWKALGENLVIGDTPLDAVARWMDETRHRKNILRNKYRDIGAGAAAYDSDGNAVYSLVFGVRK
jgi:uncharacterized protein YkwD